MIKRNPSSLAPALLLLALTGCGASGTAPQASDEVTVLSAFDLNQQPLNKTVCDPLAQNAESPGGLSGGLRTELYYLNPDQPHYSRIDDYFQYGTKSDTQLFFTRVFTPTREFSTGFVTETGETLKTNAGDRLVEYFALHHESILKLNGDQPAGDYEIALLSDDGARMRFRDLEGSWKTLINFDQNTKTRMSCAVQKLHFEPNTQYPIEIDYFQGPRYAIALVAMMRKSDASTPSESLCGYSSLTEFFDPGNNSVGGPAFAALLSRGWNVISSGNFELPVGVDFNPCAGTDVPEITNVRVTSLSGDSATVEWETDRPASSQLLVRDGSTSTTTLTTSDNVLRRKHKISLSHLKRATQYYVYAVSISYSLGNATSQPIAFTTDR